MAEGDARFEYRAFARDLGPVEAAFRALSPVTRERESQEVYVVSAVASDHNVKVRGGLLDIKALVACARGLEQWRPHLKAEFPLLRQILADDVLPALGVAVSGLAREVYSYEQFLDEIVAPHADLAAADVAKRRTGFEIAGCAAEVAEVTIAGKRLQTACLEALDPERVLAACARTGLDAFDNVNYVLAVKRVIGMAEPPFTAQ